ERHARRTYPCVLCGGVGICRPSNRQVRNAYRCQRSTQPTVSVRPGQRSLFVRAYAGHRLRAVGQRFGPQSPPRPVLASRLRFHRSPGLAGIGNVRCPGRAQSSNRPIDSQNRVGRGRRTRHDFGGPHAGRRTYRRERGAAKRAFFGQERRRGLLLHGRGRWDRQVCRVRDRRRMLGPNLPEASLAVKRQLSRRRRESSTPADSRSHTIALGFADSASRLIVWQTPHSHTDRGVSMAGFAVPQGVDAMTWIKQIPYEEADDDLKRVYESLRAMYPVEYAGPPVASLIRADGVSDSIVAAHSLIPEAMHHMMSGLAVLLRPGLGLTRRQQEMIAAVVSVENSCFY